MQDPACKEEQRIPSLPMHIHLSDHHLELVTSSILVIINSKPRQVNKSLEIQLKIYTKSNVKSPSHHVAKSPIIKPRPRHQQNIINLQKSPPKPRPSHQQESHPKPPKHQPKQTSNVKLLLASQYLGHQEQASNM